MGPDCHYAFPHFTLAVCSFGFWASEDVDAITGDGDVER